MIRMIVKWLLFAVALVVVAKIIPGIQVANFTTAMIAVVVIGLVNIFIRPIVEMLSLPINVVTLGLFAIVINTALFALSAYLMPGFEVSGFLAAFLGSLLFSVFSTVVNNFGNAVPA